MYEEALDKETVDEFETITNFPLTQFMNDYSDFIKEDLTFFISYYSGYNTYLRADSFNRFESLKQRVDSLFEIVASKNRELGNYKFWVLLEMCERIKVKIDTIDNASKWFRSSVRDVKFSAPYKEVVLKQNQTLEALLNEQDQSDILNSSTDLAINNNLKEEDYTTQGGNLLRVVLESNIENVFLNSVVDNLQGDSVLGKDFQNKLEFDDNDLKTLEYRETFKQTVQILSALRRGDNPEFRNSGLDLKNIIGVSLGALAYPTIVRQLTELFSSDDTIKSFLINKMKRETDALFIEFTVESKLSESENILISI